METFVLVVMENGSDWPAHLHGAAMNCVALCQEPEESRTDLLRRTYDRLRGIERLGGLVGVALLSCNDDGGAGSLEGRAPLARALLASVVRTGKGRLELMARPTAPARATQSLRGLAEALTESLADGSASVLVRTSGASASPVARHARKPLLAPERHRPAA